MFFTSNTHNNKLYLNKGNFKFEDITTKSGIVSEPGFNTGVTIADVNNDGFVDIYVSRGGWDDSNNKFANKLYVNNGNLTFTEKAEELGIADKNRSINAVFFDYDNDNDVYLYVSNTPYNADPTGATDCLAGIQKAVNDGTNYATIEEFNNQVNYKNVA